MIDVRNRKKFNIKKIKCLKKILFTDFSELHSLKDVFKYFTLFVVLTIERI